MQLLTRSIAIAPDGEPDKYLYMAQLCGGHEALGFYEKALDLLQIEPSADTSKDAALRLKQKLCMAYCSVGELFLTDLCFEENAEQRCQVSPSSVRKVQAIGGSCVVMVPSSVPKLSFFFQGYLLGRRISQAVTHQQPEAFWKVGDISDVPVKLSLAHDGIGTSALSLFP